jgi:hypothetical protein
VIYEIDWAASGTWMQAWAGFAQAAAIAFAAVKAADVFHAWRRQKLEERRIHHAEEILKLFNKIYDGFPYFRNAMHLPHEIKQASDHLKDVVENYELRSRSELSRMETAQVILNRISRFNTEWDKLNDILPAASAFFGDECKVCLDQLWRNRNMVSINAENYARGTGNDDEFRMRVERSIWMMHQDRGREDDPIEAPLLEAKTNLEAILLPVIRQSK